MKIALVLSEFVPVAIVPKYIELLLTLPLIIIANEKTYIEHGERVREYSLLASNTLLMYILLKLLNKIKNTYIFYIDISVINFSLIFELNKYSNLFIQIYRFNDFELNKELVGKTTLIGTVTPPNGFTTYDILTYNIYYIASGDVNYGAFYIPAGTPNIYFTYLKHGYNTKGLSLRVVWKK